MFINDKIAEIYNEACDAGLTTILCDADYAMIGNAEVSFALSWHNGVFAAKAVDEPLHKLIEAYCEYCRGCQINHERPSSAGWWLYEDMGGYNGLATSKRLHICNHDHTETEIIGAIKSYDHERRRIAATQP